VTVWSARRVRALALADERPHAAEILRCYAEVTEAQERIAGRIPTSAWESAAQSSDEAGALLRLERLPAREVLRLFADFLDEMAEVGTEVMRAEARRLASVGDGERRLTLDSTLSTSAGDDANFHARAFVETIATTLAGRVHPALGAPASVGPAACLVCDAPPVVATLRDLPDALGAGGLVCSRCGYEQRVRRLTCAHCGESNADRLRVHTPESTPHVRIDECEACRTYLKTVDLRRQGTSVPIVEDLATPELDLWARARGLTKGRTNVLGM